MEDQGVVTDTVNPYFNVQSIKLYEGPDSNLPKKERKYVTAFSARDTRYVWVEVNCENLVKDQENWNCEFFFNFKTHSGQLKGSIEKIIAVNTKEATFECSIGWGSDLKGTWGNDVYTVDIVFMDQILTSLSFEVGDLFVDDKNLPKQITQARPKARIPEKAKSEDQNVERHHQ